MKQSKLVFMIGALVVMISAVAFITACENANDPKNNLGDSLEVKPTGEADSKLAGTSWESEGRTASISFASKGNLAYIMGVGEAVYTIKDTKITFDISSYIAIYKNMTVDKYIQLVKADMKAVITELEKMIKQETNAETKKELERRLKSAKEELKAFENPSAELKQELQEDIQYMNKVSAAMEAHAKFEGEFNADKTELTIEKFPVYDRKTEEATVKKVVLKQR